MKRRSFLSSAAATVAWPFAITRRSNVKDEWWRCVTETYGYLDTYYCLGDTPRWFWHPVRRVVHEPSDDSKSVEVMNEGRRVVLDREELTELRRATREGA